MRRSTLTAVLLVSAFAAAGEIGEITWRGMVPGDGVLNSTDPKAGIDEIVQHGLNVIWRFESSSEYGKTNDWARLKDIYAYARAKGVRVLLIASTAVWHRNNRPKDVSFNDWPCLKHSASWTDHCYCWSDDQLTEDAANRYADHLVGSGAEDAIVMIHPVDTGGQKDPEHWSQRCARCKARWADDERWKATVNQLTIWNRVLKSRCPKVTVGSCLYPYKLDNLREPPEKRDADWQKNFYDYWRHVDEGIEDESFFFGSWIYSDVAAKEVRSLVKRRPLQIHDCYPYDCGVFSTIGRRAALTMDKKPGNIFCSYMDCTRTAWETYFFLAEYLKDQTLPGSVPYDGLTYYNPLTDHTGPAECRPVLANICREFWGEALAPDLEAFLWSGVLPRYIENPGEIVRQWNKWLSFAQYDPTGGSASITVIDGATKVVDDAKFMRDQANKAEVAAAAIGRALAKLGLDAKSTAADWKKKMPKAVQRDSLKQRARNCRHWLMAARLQANLREFDDLYLAGDAAGAADKLATAKRQYAEDLAVAQAWGEPPRREWTLKRETLEKELAKAELSVRLAAKPDAAKAAEMRARAWALPKDPQPLMDYPAKNKMTLTWSGEVVVDKPLELPSHKLRVLPGTKVLFKGEGRINLVKGALTAWGATFEADSVLTNNFRVAIDMGSLYLNGCTFRSLRTVKAANWSRGMMAASVQAESRVENCLFEDCSPVVLMMSRRATFANNRITGGFGGFGGVFVSASHQMSITGNVFENVRGRAVDLQGGDGVLVADNVFIACEEGIGGYEGIGGWSPGVGNCILGNAFFGLRNPVRFKSNPFLSGVVAGNWFEGCTALTIKDDAKRPHREFDNVFRP